MNGYEIVVKRYKEDEHCHDEGEREEMEINPEDLESWESWEEDNKFWREGEENNEELHEIEADDENSESEDEK